VDAADLQSHQAMGLTQVSRSATGYRSTGCFQAAECKIYRIFHGSIDLAAESIRGRRRYRGASTEETRRHVPGVVRVREAVAIA